MTIAVARHVAPYLAPICCCFDDYIPDQWDPWKRQLHSRSLEVNNLFPPAVQVHYTLYITALHGLLSPVLGSSSNREVAI